MCVPENNYGCDGVKVRVRVCIGVQLPVRIVTLRLSIRRRSQNIPHYLIYVAARGRPGLVFFLVFKTSAGASDAAGLCDCRHVCDVEESHHEDHAEGDHVHDEHNDHCTASGTEDCTVMFSFFICTILSLSRVFFGLCGVAASSLVGLYDLVLVSLRNQIFRRSDVNPLFFCKFVKFIHVRLRVSLFVHAHLVLLVLEVALHDRSVFFFWRNQNNLLLSCVCESAEFP